MELPVKLDRGIVHLLQDYRICTAGEILSAQQCRVLKYFEVKLAEFRMNLDAMYEVQTHAVIVFKQQDADTRALEHLTYNHITLTEDDYEYKWVDEPSGDQKTEMAD